MGSNHTPHGRRATAAVILAGTLALTACGGDDDDASSTSADIGAEAPADEPAFESTADGGFIASDDSGSADVAIGDAASGDGVDPGFDIGVIGRDVIIEMRVVLSSDNIQRTVASIMASASALGGGVASSDVNYGNDNGLGNEGFAVLVVKVPPQAVDRLIGGLDDTGEVQSINQSAQDVTEQLVNLDVRIQNARQSVTNVREFMDRTGNLNELVTLEAELTRRQTELEQLEAQQRNIADRVALSTVTIEVIPTAAVPEPVVVDDDDSIADAFRSGWDAFTAVLFAIAFVFAATLPFLIVGLLVSLVLWLAIRRRDANGSVDRPPTHLPHPVADTPDTVTPTDQIDQIDEVDEPRPSQPV